VTGGSLTWKPSKQTTTFGTPTTTSPGQGLCPKKWTEEDTTDTITGGTSTYTHAGDVVSSKTCNKGSIIKLAPGTVASL
jgi:hypothetical protein